MEKICPICRQTFECRADDIAHCQCAGIVLSEADRIALQGSVAGCVCVDCLRKLQGELSRRAAEERGDAEGR